MSYETFENKHIYYFREIFESDVYFTLSVLILNQI